MGKRFNSSEVFEFNATTKVELDGAIMGIYRPTGPNKWDDFEFEKDDGDHSYAVPSGSKIQVEPIGASPEVLFRVKKGREVLVLRWSLNAEDEREVASGKWGIQEAEQASRLEKILGLVPKNDPRDDMMEYFLDRKVDTKS